ncbi:hypothetical protein [Nonomuraea sp. NPDC048916]|uniref:hypothetical protein n=1 Tax=Nonomuraea sp. NPDC048916 TaxID=3154232 RepID=UPI0033D486F0
MYVVLLGGIAAAMALGRFAPFLADMGTEFGFSLPTAAWVASGVTLVAALAVAALALLSALAAHTLLPSTPSGTPAPRRGRRLPRRPRAPRRGLCGPPAGPQRPHRVRPSSPSSRTSHGAVRSRTALATGAVTQLGSLGTLFGPPLYGGAVGQAGWAMAAIVTATLTLLGLGALRRSRR